MSRCEYMQPLVTSQPPGQETSRRSPDGGGLLVAEHHVTGEGLAVGPDLGPDLRPPAVPGLTLLRVVDPVQQLHRAGAHRAACQAAGTETGNGVTTG